MFRCNLDVTVDWVTNAVVEGRDMSRTGFADGTYTVDKGISVKRPMCPPPGISLLLETSTDVLLQNISKMA